MRHKNKSQLSVCVRLTDLKQECASFNVQLIRQDSDFHFVNFSLTNNVVALIVAMETR